MPLQTQRGGRVAVVLSILTSAMEGDSWPNPRPGRLTPWQEHRWPFYWRMGWAPWSIWTGVWRTKFRALSEVRAADLLASTESQYLNVLLSLLMPRVDLFVVPNVLFTNGLKICHIVNTVVDCEVLLPGSDFIFLWCLNYVDIFVNCNWVDTRWQ